MIFYLGQEKTNAANGHFLASSVGAVFGRGDIFEEQRQEAIRRV